MSDNTELQRLAEAAKTEEARVIKLCASGAGWEALPAQASFRCVASPEAVLDLIAEIDGLSNAGSQLRAFFVDATEQCCKAERERDQLRAEVAGLRTGYEAYEQVNGELKAKSDAIRAAYMASGEREHELRVERETLRKAVTYAVDMFSRVSSGDGSGHADIGRAVLRLAGAALGQGEQS